MATEQEKIAIALSLSLEDSKKKEKIVRSGLVANELAEAAFQQARNRSLIQAKKEQEMIQRAAAAEQQPLAVLCCVRETSKAHFARLCRDLQDVFREFREFREFHLISQHFRLGEGPNHLDLAQAKENTVQLLLLLRSLDDRV